MGRSRARGASARVGARVGGEVFSLEVRAVDVGVDLRGGDVGMPENLLDHTQVGPALKQMRGEGVAQRVGMQPLDADALPRLGDDAVDGLPRETAGAR